MSLSEPMNEQIKPTTSPLTPMDKVDNGVEISFQCDSGYNIQGSNSIKCIDGNWSSAIQAECLPAPCVLPEIMHASYQGGYRAGLTIGKNYSLIYSCLHHDCKNSLRKYNISLIKRNFIKILFKAP